MAYNPFDDVIENDPAYKMQTGGVNGQSYLKKELIIVRDLLLHQSLMLLQELYNSYHLSQKH